MSDIVSSLRTAADRAQSPTTRHLMRRAADDIEQLRTGVADRSFVRYADETAAKHLLKGVPPEHWPAFPAPGDADTCIGVAVLAFGKHITEGMLVELIELNGWTSVKLKHGVAIARQEDGMWSMTDDQGPGLTVHGRTLQTAVHALAQRLWRGY